MDEGPPSELPEVPESDAHEPRAPKRRFHLPAILPIVSMGLALVSFYVAEVARSDVARMDVLKTEYALFQDLARLQMQYPLMTHLLSTTEQTYDMNVAQIRTAFGAKSDAERAATLLQERAAAHYIFTTYEETYYIWKQAEAAEDERRETIARDNLAFFNTTLFCHNPRLRWYWDFKGGKLGRSFADSLGTFFDEHVTNDADCVSPGDSVGPFGGEGGSR